MRLVRRNTIANCCWLTLAVVSCGCASRGNVELLEARLRDREEELRSLNTRIERTQSELVASRRLNETLKKQMVQPASHQDAADLSEDQFRVVAVKINSLLTGGLDLNETPGDDQIALVFAPQDAQGQAVRAAGSVECELHDSSKPADQQVIGRWNFDEVELNDAWQVILGKPAYRVHLKWQAAPENENLAVHLRFRTAHGDRFETDATVRISNARE